MDKLKLFFISGGMPEAVVALLEKQDTEKTQQVLQNILSAYSLDFSKHAENKEIPKINHLWASIPSQLARDNKKFLYQTVKRGVDFLIQTKNEIIPIEVKSDENIRSKSQPVNLFSMGHDRTKKLKERRRHELIARP